MKRKSLYIGLTIFVAAITLFLLLSPSLGGEKLTYPEFQTLVEGKKVDSITVDGETLSVKTIDGKDYTVSNPDYPTFKRDMMEKGIIVKDESLTIDDILNTIFNVIFLGLVAFGLMKLLRWYSSTFRSVRHTGVHFSDIAGLDEVKSDMSAIVSSLKSGRNEIRVKGIILEGPPGNGKTLFARALAEECGVNFIATKGADFQGAVMGLGAMKVKMLFSKARKRKPCIIFIDEFDSIGEKRNYAGSGIDKENNRILTTLLNEMDGFTRESGVLVLAATNSFQSLDAALIRPGRFDLKYSVSNPDSETRKALVELSTKSMTLTPDLTLDALSSIFDGLSSAAIVTVLREADTIAKATSGGTVSIKEVVIAAQKCREKLNIRIKK